MLTKCRRVLLLSDVSSFVRQYRELAIDSEVCFQAESIWNAKYRVEADVIIAGGKYLKDINKNYYSSTVIILKEGESPAPYIKEGIMRFIFDYKNTFELVCAFYKAERDIIYSNTRDIHDILKCSKAVSFSFGNYDFNFSTNNFFYKGKAIYLTDTAKKFLAEWLLNGNKNNKKRMLLCNLRKKFGEDFLKEVDVHGNIKEEYYEQ